MAELRERFGRLVAVHRRRRRMTQERLAEKAKLSPHMIAKVETGATGVSFRSIERLAAALDVDAAELFTTDLPRGSASSRPYQAFSLRLAELPEDDFSWIVGIVDAALSPRKPARPMAPSKARSTKAGRMKRPKR